MKFKDVRFGRKVGQIGPESDKSGTFLDTFSVYFGSQSQNEQKTYLKESQIFPILCHSGPIRVQI